MKCTRLFRKKTQYDDLLVKFTYKISKTSIEDVLKKKVFSRNFKLGSTDFNYQTLCNCISITYFNLKIGKVILLLKLKRSLK